MLGLIYGKHLMLHGFAPSELDDSSDPERNMKQLLSVVSCCVIPLFVA